MMSTDGRRGERAAHRHAGHRLGREGEARAAGYLVERGYRILERNAHAAGVEIDLVVSRAGWIVFVEVKTRSGERAGSPHEAVDERKQTRLRRGAAAWLRSRARHPRAVRFDVVACLARGEAWKIVHWEGAF